MNHYIYKRYFRIALAALLLTAFAAANIGCTPFDYYDPTLEQPAPADTAIPSELAKVTLPAYRIEPPDVISSRRTLYLLILSRWFHCRRIGWKRLTLWR